MVDDGSTDQTAEVVSGAGIAGLQMIRHQQNRGASAARNTGIAAAAGGLVTDRLDLEPLVEAHAASLLEGLGDPRLYHFMKDVEPPSLRELEARLGVRLLTRTTRSVSPTQAITPSPDSSAARARRATLSSVSPKSWRRSECPTSEPCTPSSSSILGETSPV